MATARALAHRRCTPAFVVSGPRIPATSRPTDRSLSTGPSDAMTTEITNGHAHAWVATASGIRSPHNGTGEVDDAANDAPARSTSALTDTAELHRALSTSQGQMVAALRQIDKLQKSDKVLKQEVNQLAQAVAQARRFAHHDQLTGLAQSQPAVGSLQSSRGAGRAAAQTGCIAVPGPGRIQEHQ